MGINNSYSTDLFAFHASRVQNPGAMARDSVERMNGPYRAVERVYPPFGALEQTMRAFEAADRAAEQLRETFRYDNPVLRTLKEIERANAPPVAVAQFMEAFAATERLTPPISEGLLPAGLDYKTARSVRNALAHGQPLSAENYDILFERDAQLPKEKPVIAVGSAIVPEKPVAEGVLVKCTSLVWASIVNELRDDWRKAYQIPPRVWEEIIAGAFKKADFDEVILTPRSGDHGRDVIATRNGVGSIRILGSVKAYNPGHLIAKEEVHALMGVVALDPNASKGLFATTSDFAPMLLGDPRLAASVPHRIELMNGQRLQQWLISLIEPL